MDPGNHTISYTATQADDRRWRKFGKHTQPTLLNLVPPRRCQANHRRPPHPVTQSPSLTIAKRPDRAVQTQSQQRARPSIFMKDQHGQPNANRHQRQRCIAGWWSISSRPTDIGQAPPKGIISSNGQLDVSGFNRRTYTISYTPSIIPSYTKYTTKHRHQRHDVLRWCTHIDCTHRKHHTTANWTFQTHPHHQPQPGRYRCWRKFGKHSKCYHHQVPGPTTDTATTQ